MEQITGLLEGIVIDNRAINFQFTFCSDWKFLALLIGIKQANSTWFCPWSMCAREYRNSITTDWNKFPRYWGIDNTCYDCTTSTCVDKTHGQDPTIKCLLLAPFSRENTVIDTLHCLLRTSEILEEVLYVNVDMFGLNLDLERFSVQNGSTSSLPPFSLLAHIF